MPSTKEASIFGNLTAVCAILFGLLAAFSGTDIPIILGIYVIGAIYFVVRLTNWEDLIKANKAPLLLYLLLTALIIYMVAPSIGKAQALQSTQQYLASYIIGFGFFVLAIRSSAFVVAVPRRAIVAGFLLLMALLLIEAIFHYPMYRFANPKMADGSIEFNLGRAAYILLILFWPAVLAMRNLQLDIRIPIFSFIAMGYLATQFGIDLNFVIFCVAALIVLIARKFPKVILTSLSLVLTTLIVLANKIYPLVANLSKNYLGTNIPISYGRRADMWIFATDRIKEHPIFGLGLDSARTFSDRVDYAGFQWTSLQMHPHSAPLHIWLEGGIIGATLVCFIVLAILYLALKSKKMTGRDGWAFIGAYSTIIAGWAISYSIWEQWLWAVSFFVIGFSYLAADNVKLQTTEKTLAEI